MASAHQGWYGAQHPPPPPPPRGFAYQAPYYATYGPPVERRAPRRKCGFAQSVVRQFSFVVPVILVVVTAYVYGRDSHFRRRRPGAGDPVWVPLYLTIPIVSSPSHSPPSPARLRTQIRAARSRVRCPWKLTRLVRRQHLLEPCHDDKPTPQPPPRPPLPTRDAVPHRAHPHRRRRRLLNPHGGGAVRPRLGWPGLLPASVPPVDGVAAWDTDVRSGPPSVEWLMGIWAELTWVGSRAGSCAGVRGRSSGVGGGTARGRRLIPSTSGWPRPDWAMGQEGSSSTMYSTSRGRRLVIDRGLRYKLWPLHDYPARTPAVPEAQPSCI